MRLAVQVTFDCADPRALAGFWNETLGYRSDDPALRVRHVGRVPEGKTAKNRVHLDVRAADGLTGDERMTALEARPARLVELGATRVRRFEPGEARSAGFVVMLDPEGNEFCLD